MWRTAVTLLVGCTQVYGLDETSVNDLEPPPCAQVRFNTPQLLGQFLSGPEFDGQLSADGLEVWFVTNDGGTERTIYRATRPDLTAPFGTPEVVFGPGPSFIDPALTADGKRLLYLRNGEVVEVVRADPASPFDPERIVAGLGSFGIDSIDLSWDGLRIYFTSNAGELFYSERPTRDAPFAGATPLLLEGIEFPTVSGDEREIFYAKYRTEAGRVYRRERASRAEPFGDETLVTDNGSDADVSPSSDKLVIARDSGLYILERVCPAK